MVRLSKTLRYRLGKSYLPDSNVMLVGEMIKCLNFETYQSSGQVDQSKSRLS